MRARMAVLTLLLGVGLGLGIAYVTPTVRNGYVWMRPQPTNTPIPLPTPEPTPSRNTSWKPQIAFQYYGTDADHTTDPQFLAEHVAWVMMRYGAEQTRDAVYESGYTNVLPQYMLMFQISGPGPYKNSDKSCKNDYTPLGNNALWTKDFCDTVHENEDWFLHNSKGERLYMKEQIWNGDHNYEYFMNPGSEGFRAYWIEQVRKQDGAWDSFFLDNVAATYQYISQRADNGSGGLKEYDSLDDWHAAVAGMLQEIRTAFPERQLWGNVIESPPTPDAWNSYRDLLDGIQEENFATNWVGSPALTVDTWEAMIMRAERTLQEGRSVVLYAQGNQDDYTRMRFGLASYLLVATPDNRATFRYARTTYYSSLWWYPEYETQLGEPLGPRYQQDTLWVRQFACGQVTVDPANGVGTISRAAACVTN